MPEQLDLFAAQILPETESVARAAEKLAQRKLMPPAIVEAPEFTGNASPVVVPPAEPLQPKGREILKAEAVKIAESVEEPLKAKREVTAKIQPAVKEKISGEEKPKTTRGRKSIKDMSREADLPEVPEDDILFSKQYYGIGEVASMFHVNASLLRYWESEFDILKPRKNGKGDRFFRPEDIKNLQVIHHLLRQKKYTIEGAKDYLKNNSKSKEKFEMVKQLQHLRNFLLEMKAGLK